MALKIFVDFDGTITRQDVGNALFRTFGGSACDTLVARYRGGEIGARECFRSEAEAMGRFSVRELNAFIDSQEIDPAFAGFVDFCSAAALELRIVSDGLGYYLERILARHGLTGVTFFANTLTLVEQWHGRPARGSSQGSDEGTARAAIDFPYSDAECRRCACCKRNIMLTSAGEEDVLCLVGEGFSDQCPARYADIVFAKESLQTYCQRENISYYPYTTFADVTARMRTLASRARLRPRRRAAEERRAAFARES